MTIGSQLDRRPHVAKMLETSTFSDCCWCPQSSDTGSSLPDLAVDPVCVIHSQPRGLLTCSTSLTRSRIIPHPDDQDGRAGQNGQILGIYFRLQKPIRPETALDSSSPKLLWDFRSFESSSTIYLTSICECRRDLALRTFDKTPHRPLPCTVSCPRLRSTADLFFDSRLRV
jgi:hypothetical protein